MTAEDTAEPTLAITEQAIEKVRGFRAQSEDPESQALWVEVSGVAGGEYVYKIFLNALHVARQGDVVQRHGDLAIVVPEPSVEKLRGATIVRATLAAEALEGRVRLGRRAVATLDPVGAEQPAERLRLGLSGDHRHANGLVFHAASVTSYAVRRSGRASPSSR